MIEIRVPSGESFEVSNLGSKPIEHASVQARMLSLGCPENLIVEVRGKNEMVEQMNRSLEDMPIEERSDPALDQFSPFERVQLAISIKAQDDPDWDRLNSSMKAAAAEDAEVETVDPAAWLEAAKKRCDAVEEEMRRCS